MLVVPWLRLQHIIWVLSGLGRTGSEAALWRWAAPPGRNECITIKGSVLQSHSVLAAHYSCMMQKRDSAPLILTAAFVLLVLGLNFQIFTRPAVEFGDAAANSLLVQEARHFTLLTGHY